MPQARNSIKAFLAQCKSPLDTDVDKQQRFDLVSGNESADLDSLTSSLIYAYIATYCRSSGSPPTLDIPIVNIPSSDLRLRPEFTALLSHAGLKPEDLITLDAFSKSDSDQVSTVILVDHNAPTGILKERYGDRLAGCIDHHTDEGAVPSSSRPRIVTESGSCTSLVVQHFRDTWDEISAEGLSSGAAHGQGDEYIGNDASLVKHWDMQVAKLGMGSILIDTHNLQDKSKVTNHDQMAVEYLESKILSAPGGARWDRTAFFKEIDQAKRDLDGLTVTDCLRKDYKMWNEGGVKLGFSSVVKPISWLKSKCTSTESLLAQIQEFSTERELQVFVLMTAFTGDARHFQRELLVWAFGGGEVVQRTAAFADSAKKALGLAAWDGDATEVNVSNDAMFRHVWNQNEMQHSRKTVAPLVREAFSN